MARKKNFAVDLVVKTDFCYIVKAESKAEAVAKARAMLKYESSQEEFDWWSDYNGAKAVILKKKPKSAMTEKKFAEAFGVKVGKHWNGDVEVLEPGDAFVTARIKEVLDEYADGILDYENAYEQLQFSHGLTGEEAKNLLDVQEMAKEEQEEEDEDIPSLEEAKALTEEEEAKFAPGDPTTWSQELTDLVKEYVDGDLDENELYDELHDNWDYNHEETGSIISEAIAMKNERRHSK